MKAGSQNNGQYFARSTSKEASGCELDADISEAEYLAGSDENVVGKMRVEELMKLIQDMPPGYQNRV